MRSIGIEACENKGAGRAIVDWTRNIVSFGGLAAVEESGKQAVLQIRDLEGNIIGTASLSETEGKPRTLERTTEFGVPTTEKPADTYGWLGSSGLTSNLTSGTIIQDGTTYVPQLGAPLQSAPPEIPAPPLTGIPHIVTMPPPQISKYEEAQSTVGEGASPGGNVPEPEGEEGTIEYGPVLPGSHIELKNKRSGLDPNLCRLKASWGKSFHEELAVYGHVEDCTGYFFAGGVQIKVCLFELAKGKLRQYEKCYGSGNLGNTAMGFNGSPDGEFEHTYVCVAHTIYYAWAGARQWGLQGKTMWSEGVWDGHSETCVEGIEDVSPYKG